MQKKKLVSGSCPGGGKTGPPAIRGVPPGGQWGPMPPAGAAAPALSDSADDNSDLDVAEPRSGGGSQSGRECNVVSGMPKTPLSNRRMLGHMLVQTIIYMSIPFAVIYSIPYMRERSKNKKCGEAVETAKHVTFDCPALCRRSSYLEVVQEEGRQLLFSQVP
nr:unnamed protein product [Callosobruchus chinensis]